MSVDTDVAIVGAGPVGLLLACDLRQAGADVVVIDRLQAPTGESRATLLDSRSAAALLERRLEAALGELQTLPRTHFGGIPLELPAGLENRYCPQDRLEEALAERLSKLGPPVRRGHQVTGLTATPDLVEIEFAAGGRLRARWCVGCDGQDGVVGHLASFQFEAHPATRSMIRADLTDVDLPDRRLARFPRGIATSVRRPDGSTRLMVHAFGDEGTRSGTPTGSEVASTWRTVTGENLVGGTLLWSDRFDNSTRLASSYRRGRVLLAGDAAHTAPPIGGQSLNLGLADATDLAGPLARRVVRPADDDSLNQWSERRRSAAARALRWIRAQETLLFGGREVLALRELLVELTLLEPVHHILTHHLAGVNLAHPAVGHADQTIPLGSSAHREESTRSDTMSKLVGKTALVTGSSRGIGRATAVRLGREGALVAVHYASGTESAAATVATIEGEGGRAFAVQADLGAEGAVHQLFVTLEQEFKERTGNSTLDVLVNNAAITSATGAFLEDVTPEDFDSLFRINARAAFFVVQRAVGGIDSGQKYRIASAKQEF